MPPEYALRNVELFVYSIPDGGFSRTAAETMLMVFRECAGVKCAGIDICGDLHGDIPNQVAI